ncbi:MAG: HAD-IA family hydrolase [Gammaproteobacteria bacterium]|nr:HAD-IA family hydrolase [Gammaproteobacteria bacterium]
MKHLIFDFDGTLVDSFETAIKIFNILSQEFHVRQIEATDMEALRAIEAKDMLKKLHFPMYKLPFILYRAKKLAQKEMAFLKPFPGMPEVIKTLHQSGFHLGIVSSNSVENVQSWLDQHDILNCFDFVQTASQYFRKEKALLKAIKKFQLDKDHLCYIGDETRDIEAAQRSGIDAMAVTWGFNCEHILKSHHPQYIARQPDDILKVFCPD